MKTVRLVNFHCIVDFGDLLVNPASYLEYVFQIKKGSSMYLAEFDNPITQQK